MYMHVIHINTEENVILSFGKDLPMNNREWSSAGKSAVVAGNTTSAAVRHAIYEEETSPDQPKDKDNDIDKDKSQCQ